MAVAGGVGIDGIGVNSCRSLLASVVNSGLQQPVTPAQCSGSARLERACERPDQRIIGTGAGGSRRVGPRESGSRRDRASPNRLAVGTNLEVHRHAGRHARPHAFFLICPVELVVLVHRRPRRHALAIRRSAPRLEASPSRRSCGSRPQVRGQSAVHSDTKTSEPPTALVAGSVGRCMLSSLYNAEAESGTTLSPDVRAPMAARHHAWDHRLVP